MEDTEHFLRSLTSELEGVIGPEETDNIDIEVSSPVCFFPSSSTCHILGPLPDKLTYHT